MRYFTEKNIDTYIKATTHTLDLSVDDQVLKILEEVRLKGDRALSYYSKKLDNAPMKVFKIPTETIKEAYDISSEQLKNALKKAIHHITKYHEKQRIESFSYEENNRLIGQKVTPLERIGVYVPGGTAQYPSTVLMNVIPAQLAGVRSICVVTPPNQDKTVSNAVLTACYLLGIDEIYKIGGAQAIGALTYGTESIKKVDKIVGPGNRYVAAAKKLVSGIVGIDSIAGPSEVCILCDEQSNPVYVAADMLAQAEHDTFAKAIVISTSLEVLKKVEIEVNRQLKNLKRQDIASKSIASFGALVHVSTVDAMFEVVNLVAPEHLEIQLENPLNYLDRIHNAGAIFLGPYTPEPVGDYMAGPNHTLPTSQTAKFSSGLSTYDFIKRTSFVMYSKEAFIEDSEAIITIAEEETLDAHAKSIKVRL